MLRVYKSPAEISEEMFTVFLKQGKTVKISTSEISPYNSCHRCLTRQSHHIHVQSDLRQLRWWVEKFQLVWPSGDILEM